MSVQAAKKGLKIKTRFPEGIPAVLGNRDRLEQVVTNILSNSIEFTPQGGSVDVTLGEQGQWVTVTISDTGIGIPESDLPRVFDRFYRVDKARSRRMGGTGLGLSIAKEIVQAHGGTIQVRSAPRRGTSVTINLPSAGEQHV